MHCVLCVWQLCKCDLVRCVTLLIGCSGLGTLTRWVDFVAVCSFHLLERVLFCDNPAFAQLRRRGGRQLVLSHVSAILQCRQVSHIQVFNRVDRFRYAHRQVHWQLSHVRSIYVSETIQFKELTNWMPPFRIFPNTAQLSITLSSSATLSARSA